MADLNMSLNERVAHLETKVDMMLQAQHEFQERMQETVIALEERLTKSQIEFQNESKRRLEAMDTMIDEINSKSGKKWDKISEEVFKWIILAILAYVVFTVTGYRV